MELDKIAQVVTTQDALIAVIIIACIATFEAVVIHELAKRAGSLKALFSITASIRKKRSNNTHHERNKPTKDI